jgi:hypothetical protein
MKAKKICIVCLAVLMMLPGCSQGSNHAESDTGNLADAEVSGEKIVIQDSEDTVEKNTVFTDPFADGVGLSMIHYTLGNEKSMCFGECQLRGRMGKLL